VRPSAQRADVSYPIGLSDPTPEYEVAHTSPQRFPTSISGEAGAQWWPPSPAGSNRSVSPRPNSGRNGAKWSIWVVHISAGGAASRWAVRCNVPAGSVSPRMTVRRGPVKLPSGVGQRSSVPAANRPRFRLPSTLARCARSARSGSDEKTGNGCGDWATVRPGSHTYILN
jgi:hypothetical protein